MRSVSLTWTAGITQEEATVFVEAVHEAFRVAFAHLPDKGLLVTFPEIRVYGDWHLKNADPEMDYASFTWYCETAIDLDTQAVNAEHLLTLMMREPWQQEMPHYDLALLHLPLIDKEKHRIFGQARRGRAAVLSVNELHTLSEETQCLFLLRRLTMHYLGHMVAIPILTSHAELYEQVCIMRPPGSLPRLLALARQEIEAQVNYCPRCQRDFAQRLVGISLGNN